MFRRTRLQRFVARIALFAVMMASLAPAVSHALAAAGMNAGWVEICSAGGSRWVQLEADFRPDAPPVQHADPLAHCPFCLNPAGGAGLLPPAQHVVPVAAGKPPLPVTFLAAPRPAQAWTLAPSRAPPPAL